MKPYQLLPTLIITIVSLTLAVPTATAGSSGPGWADRLNPGANGGQTVPLITSVDPATDTIQFKLPNGTIRTFKIAPNAKIMVNFVPGTFDQIKVGMQVGRIHTSAIDTLYWVEVNAIPPAPATPAP